MNSLGSGARLGPFETEMAGVGPVLSDTSPHSLRPYHCGRGEAAASNRYRQDAQRRPCMAGRNASSLNHNFN